MAIDEADDIPLSEPTATPVPQREEPTPTMEPTETPMPTATKEPDLFMAEAPLVKTESGSIRWKNTRSSNIIVGDSAANLPFQAFVSFDLSSIPQEATITHVQADFGDHSITGSPFFESDLGDLRMYPSTYGEFSSATFYDAPPMGHIAFWDNPQALNRLADAHFSQGVKIVQWMLTDSIAQFRLQFRWNSNDNGATDTVQLGDDIKLIITYYLPE